MFRNMNVDTNAYNSTSSKLRTALSSKNMGLSSSARPIGGGGGGNAWANVSMMKCEEGPDGRIVTMLQSRLEEILVFEISNDGGHEYLNMTVRALYKYVLNAITNTKRNKTTRHSRQATLESLPAVMENVPQNRDTGGVQSSLTTTSPANVVAGTYLPGMYEVTPQEHHHEDITYRERLGGYLHPRDMRRLVTPFSASNEPDLIVRRHAMLLNFDPLRAIILRDRVLVLVPEGADSLLIKLERRVRGGRIELENSVFGAPSERDPEPSVKASGEEVEWHAPGLVTSTNSSDLSLAGSESEHSKVHNLINSLFYKSDSAADSDALEDSSHSGKGKNNPLAAKPVPSRIRDSFANSTTKKTVTIRSDTFNGKDESELFSEWEEMNAKDWIDLPFALQCVDGVLGVVGSILSEDTYDLQEAILDYISRVLMGRHSMSDDPLTGIRHIKDAIREMVSRVKGFIKSMNRILDDDEDMALMNLSRLLTNPDRFIKPVTQEQLEEEAEEPELILEAHLQVCLTLLNTLELLQGRIDTAAELLDQKLDSVRNRILFANMIISTLTLCLTAAAVVGSFFGMNAPNKYENSATAFAVITTSTVLGSAGLMAIVVGSLIYTGAIPLPGVSAGR